MRDRSNLNDSFVTLDGGMDSGRPPSLIGTNQAAFLVNATNRGGYVRTRPRFLNRSIDFQGEEEVQEWFMEHCISGQYCYNPPNGSPLLVCCCGGRFFTFEITNDTAVCEEITIDGDRNTQFATKTWFCQAAQWLVAQNGSDAAFLFDGATSRRSINTGGKHEVPTGKQMAFINGRLFVVLPDGRQIAAGDLAYVTATSVIEFNEILLPASDGGQPFQIPVEGPITALVATAQMDTAAGQGVLLACTEKAVCSFNPVVQRSQWPNITLQSVGLIGNGFVNSDLAIVNGDVWGRSLEGWRSFIMARRDFSTWGNRVQSREVERIIERETSSLLQNESFVYFDNRLLGTCTPEFVGEADTGGGIVHKGIIALNFDCISSLTQTSTPAYDGLWTGLRPYGLITGEIEDSYRCFAFCRNPDNTNSLWEITKEYGDDDDEIRIQSFMESRSFTFGKPVMWKRLQSLELWIDQLIGTVNFDLKFRPDQSPCWFDWLSFQECATVEDCEEVDAFGCLEVLNLQPQYRPRINIGQPERSCTENSKIDARFGYEFQIRLAWTGNCRIKTVVIYADLKDVNPTLNCS